MTVTRVALKHGLSLAVAEWPGAGKGPAVVGVHGLTANHTCWASVADVPAPAHRLIAYDLRGRGESDKPETGYSLAHHSEDLLGLLDRFGLKKAVLVGHSLGAHIAVRFAATHPEPGPAKLVLVDGGLDVRARGARVAAARHQPPRGRVPLARDVPRASCACCRCSTGAGTTTSRATSATTSRSCPRAPCVQGGAPRHRGGDRATSSASGCGRSHHQIRRPTLIFRAPDGLLTPTDCLMTQDEAEAMAHAIPRVQAGGGARDQSLHRAAGAAPEGEERPADLPQGDLARRRPRSSPPATSPSASEATSRSTTSPSTWRLTAQVHHRPQRGGQDDRSSTC